MADSNDQPATMHVEVIKMDGDAVFNGEFSLSSTIGEVLSNLPREANVIFRLVDGGEVLDERSVLGDVLEPPSATLTLLASQELKVTGSNIAGAHTNNPSYFAREEPGTENEYVRLITVCWFEVGGTITGVQPGTYQVFVEVARSDNWNLEGTTFAVNVSLNTNRVKSLSWTATDLKVGEFQEFHVGEVVTEEAGDVRVDLFKTANWIEGLLLKSFILR
eukprot:TRINITY_DN10200_c0_g1_i1.p1 TRINITY_DN10200_c0_g1~~TRINITY_DN10200_c0_g1_i1.p1  ORF type:complete len:219 (-),score=37.02 TRINITY_DN10200_c0_g1_i1:65-721(-)